MGALLHLHSLLLWGASKAHNTGILGSVVRGLVLGLWRWFWLRIRGAFLEALQLRWSFHPGISVVVMMTMH